MCLAVYADGLCGVYPCSREGETWSVSNYLDAFEATDGLPDEFPPQTASS